MFESMDIDLEKKIELTEAFDKAVLAKTTDMMENYVEEKITEKEEILKEEYQEKVLMLEDSLDGYLDTVVEEFISENAPSYEAQITDERSKSLLEMFDQMIKVVGMDMLTITEGKEERDQENLENSDLYIAESSVDTLTQKVADMADKLVEAKREADKYLQSGLMNEMKTDLTILEGEKFEKIAQMMPFERSSSYLDKLETLKESIIDSRAEDFEVDKTTALPTAAFKQPEIISVDDALNFEKYV